MIRLNNREQSTEKKQKIWKNISKIKRKQEATKVRTDTFEIMTTEIKEEVRKSKRNRKYNKKN